MIAVRPAREEDADAVAEVSSLATATLRRTYRPVLPPIASRPRVRLKLPRLVALFDRRVVGTVQYTRGKRLFRVMNLGVHPRYRRRGVARALLRHVEDLARRAGAARVALHTVKETGNVAVFRRLGFRTLSEETDTTITSERHARLTDVYMEKPLDN